MEYKIVSFSSEGLNPENEFKKLIESHISKGWKPQGGVSVALHSGLRNLCQSMFQAMVREDTTPVIRPNPHKSNV
jgi:hypothetical protein